MMTVGRTLIFLLIFYCTCFWLSEARSDEGVCDKDGLCSENARSTLTPRYLFYDVNPPEGFNLRRDAYMRVAIMMKNLRKTGNWLLVLPPWQHLYHWQSEDITDQERLPWSTFFDVASMSKFIPVIEMSEFFQQTRQTELEQVYVLQHFKDTFTEHNFNERWSFEPCLQELQYESTEGGVYRGHFWGYSNITVKNVACLSFHGHASQLIDVIKTLDKKTIMFDHAEVVLHDRYSDKTYWDARKSMKFAEHLVDIAKGFVTETLKTSFQDDGQQERNATGGAYLCVHLRRKDFLWGRPMAVPSLLGAAQQIDKALTDLGLENVFIATDAPSSEKSDLRSLLHHKVYYYDPTPEVKTSWKDGGVAIIEQIICSRARKFIGTHESTYSFRIQEEREILGFPVEMTFSRLCGDKESSCKPPSRWTIVH